MTEKSLPNKFRTIEDNEQARINAGMDLARLIARHEANTNIMMSADELEGELTLELAKALKTYSHLPSDQFSAVLRGMYNNRISELRYKYYVTHRKEAAKDIVLDDVDDESELYTDPATTEGLVSSRMRVIDTYNRLSPVAKKVLAACITDDPRTSMVMSLVMARAATAKYVRTDIKPWHIAEAILMPVEEVTKAFSEIKRVYLEVVTNA